MLQLLRQSNIDFMKRGRLFMGLSAVAVIAAVVVLFGHGVNLGIEFTGGTELQLKYAAAPDVGAIRAALTGAGLTSQVVTTIGDPAAHEIYIRLGQSEVGSPEDLTSLVARTLRGQGSGRVDLNVADEATLRGVLDGAPLATGGPSAAEIAAAIAAARKEDAIFRSADDLARISGVSPEIADYLRANVDFGPLAIRSQSYIGPAIGHELMAKTRLAVTLSLLFMLVYIALRFQLQWGFAAVLALVHDTLITLGLFSVFGKEMSLPVVAAFLTLVGYSVNDTVVVFDRIRENLRGRVGGTLSETVNISINQTLSRTVITSGLTWVVCAALYLYGGAALNPFAFVLCAGILVGTYSSIFIASPFLVLWQQFLDRRSGRAETAAPAGSGRRAARKVRTSSSGRA